MTQEERKEVLATVEKPAHKSKKFVAWLIQQLLMAAMAIVALIKQPEIEWSLTAYMVGIVFMMGASTMYFLGKQAALDTAVRGFAMIGKASDTIKKIGTKKEDDPSG